MLKTFDEFNKTAITKNTYYDQIVDYFKANVIETNPIETHPIGLDTDKDSIEESDEGGSMTNSIAITGVDNIAIPDTPISNINIIKRQHNKRKKL